MAGGKSSADSYWPGFVDALTNVVIAMIFVVVVLAISLAFAAQLMGKKMAERIIKEYEGKMAVMAQKDTKMKEQVPEAPVPGQPIVSGQKVPRDQTPALTQTPPSVTQTPPAVASPESVLPNKTRIQVKADAPKPQAKPTSVNNARNQLLLEYPPGSVSLDDAALKSFKQAITPLGADIATKKAIIMARGPAIKLTENQRAAYLRVMSVRNELLDAGMKAENITVRIDTEADVPTPSVSVSFQN